MHKCAVVHRVGIASIGTKLTIVYVCMEPKYRFSSE